MGSNPRTWEAVVSCQAASVIINRKIEIQYVEG